MATTLGKRKRRSQLSSPQPPSPSTPAHLHALFQQHFEANYAPLRSPSAALTTTNPAPPPLSSSASSDSAWEGLSPPSSPSTTPVPVITHTTPARAKRADVPRSELRAFMKPTPPSTAPLAAKPASEKPLPRPTDPTDRALLANDLALQRLLAETHLLQPSASAHAATPAPRATPGLTTRQRALDLRVQALGAKRALVGRQAVPLGVRRGVEAKKVEREERRRREAREGGVVLERKGGGGGERRGGREERRGGGREVGGPAVGRWKGGMLVLGRGDVEAIEGRGRGMGRGKGRGRGRGRGR
ncbi:Methyl-CpG-binding domain protein 2 [Xylographa pallens]|nr:Methyl-CpG-binding domain protein 2 [Xylographa pallens]